MEKILTIRRCLRVTPALAVAALSIVVGSLVGCAAAPPRNVVVVVVDPLRPDWLGGQQGAGSATPVLDALAEQGTMADGL